MQAKVSQEGCHLMHVAYSPIITSSLTIAFVFKSRSFI